MAGKRYGSKAAYEKARRPYKMTEEEREAERKERRKEECRERIENWDTFMLLMAAAMAGGRSAGDSVKQADAAIAEIRRRFT